MFVMVVVPPLRFTQIEERDSMMLRIEFHYGFITPFKVDYLGPKEVHLNENPADMDEAWEEEVKEYLVRKIEDTGNALVDLHANLRNSPVFEV